MPIGDLRQSEEYRQCRQIRRAPKNRARTPRVSHICWNHYGNCWRSWWRWNSLQKHSETRKWIRSLHKPQNRLTFNVKKIKPLCGHQGVIRMIRNHKEENKETVSINEVVELYFKIMWQNQDMPTKLIWRFLAAFVMHLVLKKSSSYDFMKFHCNFQQCCSRGKFYSPMSPALLTILQDLLIRTHLKSRQLEINLKAYNIALAMTFIKLKLERNRLPGFSTSNLACYIERQLYYFGAANPPIELRPVFYFVYLYDANFSTQRALRAGFEEDWIGIFPRNSQLCVTRLIRTPSRFKACVSGQLQHRMLKVPI